MGKQIILGNRVMMGSLCGILMLSGCAAFQSNESVDESEWLVVETVEPVSHVEVASDGDIVPDLTLNLTETACDSADGSCVQTENYLTNQFVQTTQRTQEPIAMSRPAGQGTTSVREKMAEKEDETVWFTAVAVPEKNDDTKDKVVETSESVAEAAKPAAEKTEEVVEETVVTVDQPQPMTVETTTETAVQVETNPVKAEQQVIPVIPAGMVPLKKVTTTITETTTKYQKERKTAESAEPQTLEEKVAYGLEVHDWVADSGNTLRKLLMAWGSKSGWTVIWKLDRDYRLEAGVIFRGTFTEVSAALIRSFARATPPPIGTFYQGNRVLVISTQEDDNER